MRGKWIVRYYKKFLDQNSLTRDIVDVTDIKSNFTPFRITRPFVNFLFHRSTHSTVGWVQHDQFKSKFFLSSLYCDI